MSFLEKLDYLMKKMSINKSKLSQISGVPYTTIDGFYKKGYGNAQISTIKKLAVALSVSLDYLVDDNITDENYVPQKKTSPLPSESELDAELISRLMQLTPEEEKQVDAFVQGLLASRSE